MSKIQIFINKNNLYKTYSVQNTIRFPLLLKRVSLNRFLNIWQCWSKKRFAPDGSFFFLCSSCVHTVS